jgi:type IV pilus biogenesis protein CpaD/CtpE
MGRPEVIQQEILLLLKQAFAIGCSDEEACAYAKIPTSTFYDYQKRHPEFSEEKDRLKQEPILKAKHTIVKSLTDVKDAQWYLERKKKDEFSLWYRL